jgi:nucleoid DNA-binding protein
MNKAGLVAAMAASTGLTKKDAAAALESFMSAVSSSLKKGDAVTLTGFGTFKTVKRAARTGRNPQSGKEIKIPARTVAKFAPGKGLKDAVK